jgi:hypothetical protein
MRDCLLVSVDHVVDQTGLDPIKDTMVWCEMFQYFKDEVMHQDYDIADIA